MLVILHAERNGMHQRISGDQGVHHGREGTCPWMRRAVLQLTDALPVTPQAGRVAPDRPDVRCMSCAMAFRQLLMLVLLLCALCLS